MLNMFKGLAIFVVVAVAAVLLLGSHFAFAEEDVSDNEISLRKQSVFEEKDVTPDEGKYTGMAPGSSKKIERAFELRAQGLSYSAIGKEIGVGSSRAHQLVKEYQKQTN